MWRFSAHNNTKYKSINAVLPKTIPIVSLSFAEFRNKKNQIPKPNDILLVQFPKPKKYENKKKKLLIVYVLVFITIIIISSIDYIHM